VELIAKTIAVSSSGRGQVILFGITYEDIMRAFHIILMQHRCQQEKMSLLILCLIILSEILSCYKYSLEGVSFYFVQDYGK